MNVIEMALKFVGRHADEFDDFCHMCNRQPSSLFEPSTLASMMLKDQNRDSVCKDICALVTKLYGGFSLKASSVEQFNIKLAGGDVLMVEPTEKGLRVQALTGPIRLEPIDGSTVNISGRDMQSFREKD